MYIDMPSYYIKILSFEYRIKALADENPTHILIVPLSSNSLIYFDLSTLKIVPKIITQVKVVLINKS